MDDEQLTSVRTIAEADPTALDHVIRDRIQAERDRLVGVSHAIHAHPELAFEEHFAAGQLMTVAGAEGFDVQPVSGWPTAFTASFGSGDFVVGFCAEYDALPTIGHACGHNVIAAASLGAALGLAAVADELAVRVVLVGTPAEEHGHGKIRLIEAGVFDDITVAMMVHPSRNDVHPRAFLTQAVSRFAGTFSGRSAHAAAAPAEAINAADAAVLTQVAVGLLRQQVSDGSRIGLFVREAGRVTNVIPDLAVLECEVRAFSTEDCAALVRRVHACFQGAATATGCELELRSTEPDCAPLKQDDRLGDLYAAAAARLGRTVTAASQGTRGSTDMGNVSQLLASIHPMVAIRGSKSPSHSPGFAAAAASPEADAAVLDGALALAWTASAVARTEHLRAELLAEQAARSPAKRANPLVQEGARDDERENG